MRRLLFVLLLTPWLPLQSQGDSTVRALLRSGDSAFAAGERATAIAAYRDAVGRDSSVSSRAVYRLAVLLAQDGVFREAITLHLRYAALEPNDSEGALGLAQTYSWAGQTDDALRIYHSVLEKEPDYRAAALGAGQVLAWAARFPESVAAYRGWLEKHPEDRDAHLALARTLAWWGGRHLRESQRLYDSLRTSDHDMEARKGLAIVAAWQGDLVRSERIWRELTSEAPNDAEVWTGLAQVLRWRGQPFEARRALHRALAIAPAHRDARSQQRWLDAELAPVVHATAISTGDSDANRAQILVTHASVLPWPNVALRLEAMHVRAEVTGIERVSQTLRGKATLRLPWADGDWRARVEVGANRRPNADAADPTHVRSVGTIALSGQFSPRASGEIRIGRTVVDETVALIANGIHVTSAETDFAAQLGDRINMNAALSVGDVSSDTASNRRLVTVLGARWLMTHSRSFGLSLRTITHDYESRDGYFSPKSYQHLELNAKARRGRDLGWVLSGDAGLGVQRISYRSQLNTQPTQRLTGTLSYVWAPGLEWSLTGTLANVAMAMTSTATGYRFGSLSLGGRVPLR